MTAPLLTIDQVCERTQLERSKIMRLIFSGELAAYNLGGTGRGARYRIDPRDLDRWLQSTKVSAA